MKDTPKKRVTSQQGAKMQEIFDVLRRAAPQLRNVGSFNPAKLEPKWKDFLMRAERVYIDTFGGGFKEFFGAVATLYANAQAEGTDFEEDIKVWLAAEIAELDKAAHKEKKHRPS